MSTQFEQNFQEAFNGAPKFLAEVTDFRTANGNIVEDVFHLAAPSMQEFTDTREWNNVLIGSEIARTKIWYNGIKVSRSEVLSDNWGVRTDEIKSLALKASNFADQELARKLLSGATLAPGQITFDGVAKFSQAHKWTVDSAYSYSNYNPSAFPLNEANYGAVLAAQDGFLDNTGNPFMFTDRVLIVPTQLGDAAKKILMNDLLINAAGTAAGSNIYKGTSRLIVCPFLNSQPTAWYVAAKANGVAPFRYHSLKDPSFQAYDQPTDPDVRESFTYKYGSDLEGVATLTLPITFIKSVG